VNCALADGGLFAPAYTIDAGVGPNYVLDSESGGHPFALGDVNGDGNLDILLTNALTGDMGLLLGNGDGTFQPVQRSSIDAGIGALVMVPPGSQSKALWALAAQSIDFGQLDFLRIGQSGVAEPYPSITRWASQLVSADLNGDGWPDLLAGGSSLALYLGGPSGFTALPVVSATFIWTPSPVSTPVFQNPLADFNEDGIPDLLAWITDGGLEFLPGNGDGTFAAGKPVGAALPASSWLMEVLIGDIDEDGHLDIVEVPDDPQVGLSVAVWFGTGQGSFLQGSTFSLSCFAPFSCNVPTNLLDLNGDGHLDLVQYYRTADGYRLAFAFGNGDGTFQTPLVDPTIPGGAFQFGDVNNDGRPDLIMSHVKEGSVDIRLNCR
jgi:hypothetical protein